MVQKVAVKHEFEAGLRYATTGIFFKLGNFKNKAAKAEGWAPPFIRCAQDVVGF